MRSSNDNIERLVDELQQLRVREAEIVTLLQEEPLYGTTSSTIFAIGDRVWIKNRVRKPKTWSNDNVWDDAKAKRATVTKIVHAHAQVHFITDNGVRTWRAPGNLRRLQQDE